MLDKQNVPISIEKKIKISPIDYSKLNKIKEDFGKCFVTQKELSTEQAFWLKHASLSETPVKSHTPVRIEAPSELPKCSVDKNVFEIQIIQLRIDSDQLLNQITSQEIVHIVANSMDILEIKKSCVNDCSKCPELETELLKKKDFIEKEAYDKLVKSYSTLEKHCISLELATQLNQEIFQRKNSGENLNAPTFNQLFEINELKAQSQENDTVIRKLKEIIKSLSGKDSVENVKKDIDEIETINIELEHTLKNELRKLKGKNVVNTVISKPNATIAPGMFKIDIEPISPRLKYNRDAHEVYIEKTIEYTDTLRGFVESARTQNPSELLLESACMFTKRVQELLVYVSQTCPNSPKPSEKLVAVTPMNKDKRVRFAKPVTSSSNIPKQTNSLKTKDSNKPLLTSTGVKPATSATGSKPSGNTKNNRITRPPSSNQKNKVEDHSRKVKSSLNKTNSVSEPVSNAFVKHSVRNAKFESICAICNKCLFDVNHDRYIIDYVNDVNVCSKSKSKRNKKRKVWKPTPKAFTNVGYNWKPIGRFFNIVGNSCPLTRITPKKIVHLKETTSKSVETPKPEIKVYSRRPKQIKSVGSSKKAKIVESKIANNSKPTYLWGSNATYVPSSSSLVNDRLSRSFSGIWTLNVQTYDKEPLSAHELRSRDTNLYIISLDDMLKTSPICLLSKASKTKKLVMEKSFIAFNSVLLIKLAKDEFATRLFVIFMENVRQFDIKTSIARTPQQSIVFLSALLVLAESLNPQETQQVAARDETWVPFTKRVNINSTHVKLETTVPQKEETFQVIINLVKNSSCFKAFTISANVPEIFMQQTILDICPRVEGMNFTDVPDDDTTLAFLIKLGYKGPLYKHTNIFVDHMHQPWRTLAAIINKCLSVKIASNDKLYLAYHIDHMREKISSRENMSFPRFTKETVDVSKESKPEPEAVKRKTSSKSISQTEAEEAEAARQVHATHARIMTESVPESAKKKSGGRSSKSVVIQDTPSAPKSKPATSKTKLKGASSLTLEEQEDTDIIQALKESKKRSKRQPGTGGSNEGIGTIPGVPNESTVISATSSEGTGIRTRNFRTILNTCPRVEVVNFTDVPDDDTTLAFLIKLSYKGPLYKHTNMFVDHMHQPWRTLAVIINKCLFGKTTSNDKLQTEPEPESVKRKTSSKRRVKKKVTLPADDNIISYDPNTALELGKSISQTKAEETEAARQANATHARIITEIVPESAKKSGGGSSKSVVIQDTPNAPTSKPSTSKTKLKGAPSLTPEEQDAADIMQALKETEKQKMPKFTIKSTNKAALKEFDLKIALYSTMHANKSFRHSQRPNQGKETKRRRTKDSESLKKPSTTNETPKGKAPSKGSKTGSIPNTASAKEPVKEPIAEVVMDDVGDDECHPRSLTVFCDLFFNNDLEYAKSSEPKETYTTSTRKTKAARYEIVGIEDMVPMLWSPTKVGYDKKILSVKSVSVKKLHGYGHLEEVMVKRADRQLYKFKEGDAKEKVDATGRKRSELMVELVDKQMHERRIIWNLERLVGARELEMDYKLMTHEWLKTEMENQMCGQDKENEEDALIAILKSLVGECKAVYINKGSQIETSSHGTNKVQGVSFVTDEEEGDISGALPCPLPPKELKPGSFTLPCTIGSLNLYAKTDLGANVNVIPKSIFEHLKLAN
ncbi:hypothetical protein Tco_0168169 [Tanacetum coccineum]